MKTAVLSAVSGGTDVEVLIVDDGSTDGTADIGKQLAQDFPESVKYIHKENGGHGDAVMTGLSHASGLYFKVLDSDDWLDDEALPKVVTFLRAQAQAGVSYDMFLCNYVYEKAEEKHKVTMSYADTVPVDQVFTWDETERFKIGQYILMHSVIYRTQLLRDCGLTLPKHTFYVDNIYVYYPLPYVKTLYYMNLDLYHYFIGRADQSVNEAVMISRIDQQIRVTELMINMYQLSDIQNEKLRDYMGQYLTIMMTVTSALLVVDGTEESLAKKERLWENLRNYNEEEYTMIKNRFLGRLMEKDGRVWNKIIEKCYALAQRLYHFN